MDPRHTERLKINQEQCGENKYFNAFVTKIHRISYKNSPHRPLRQINVRNAMKAVNAVNAVKKK